MISPLLAVLPLLAAAPPDARPLLEKVRASYSASPSFTLGFVQTYTPAGFGPTTPERGRVTLQAPDRVRFDYDGKEGKVFTFDGQAARQYVAADRQLVLKTLSEAERARLPLVFFESPDKLLRRYEDTVRSGDGGLTEVVLAPRDKLADNELKSLTLFVAADGEVHRLDVVDAGGNRTSFALSDRKAGARRPASDFALEPPAGTRVVTE